MSSPHNDTSVSSTRSPNTDTEQEQFESLSRQLSYIGTRLDQQHLTQLSSLPGLHHTPNLTENKLALESNLPHAVPGASTSNQESLDALLNSVDDSSDSDYDEEPSQERTRMLKEKAGEFTLLMQGLSENGDAMVCYTLDFFFYLFVSLCFKVKSKFVSGV